MSKRKRNTIRSAASLFISVVLLLAAAWTLLNRQYIVDQLSVWQYEPTTEVAAIADRVTLTNQGKFYFYASDPAIETASDFNANCQRQEPQSAILGCYTNSKIYIYAVDNAQLDGIEEVTAAHEILHAAWDRMSEADRESIGRLLEAAYNQINDSDFKSRMDYYDRNEPGERLNELHSILGTEYPNLSSDLESHYSKYFVDRTKVVSLHASYQTVFYNLKVQSNALLNELEALKAELDIMITRYNNEVSALQNDYNALVGRSSSVDRTSSAEVNQYNAELAALRVRSNELDKSRTNIIVLQSSYNAKVETYNKLIVASNNLVKSIDSTLAPEPSL